MSVSVCRDGLLAGFRIRWTTRWTKYHNDTGKAIAEAIGNATLKSFDHIIMLRDYCLNHASRMMHRECCMTRVEALVPSTSFVAPLRPL